MAARVKGSGTYQEYQWRYQSSPQGVNAGQEMPGTARTQFWVWDSARFLHAEPPSPRSLFGSLSQVLVEHRAQQELCLGAGFGSRAGKDTWNAPRGHQALMEWLSRAHRAVLGTIPLLN